MNNNYDKYIKYKKKYLELLKKINQKGGTINMINLKNINIFEFSEDDKIRENSKFLILQLDL